ncbi:serine/threonine protein kinase [Bradymonas sediminis]|uniref:non-specific serine/threonine protein kinase n=1 Tax=Bradymonas sediminis TaxID=1548548 RepID=A0A2Z4FKZ1_9DELT|nr:serine/threonine-protein kinase [Bradymonas sediminis]AWV89661.1 hypothetical protein DN745_10050 [Bradymonas sediminis]TDP76599.1 serine/threonine protein kinase [Bradymonas sediminis]
MADEIDNPAGGDTNPSFGKKDSADPVVSDVASAQPGSPTPESEPKVVKICKTCMVSQSGVGGYCVSCGSALVPIRAVRETYVGEVVGGKYKIVDRLGAGGMGEVYLGVNEPLGQQVAVKFLSQKFTADENIILRFLNEARSYCKVTHPNAVTLLEYGQHEDGALYLITEFIDGKSLSDTLKDVGPFPLDQVISISTQICEVLSAAHGQGVIHRDLKPDNIMLMPTSRGRYAVKVLDFGIAKIMDDDHANGAMTETGSVFGTPEFMSPEQACGDSTDGRSDLYAAGIILFYLATGKLPFKGKNKLVVLHKQLHEAPPLPSEARDDITVVPELERIILKCLRKAPEQRFQSADELLGALEAIDTSHVPRIPRPNAAVGVFQDTNPESPHAHDSIETVVQSDLTPHSKDSAPEFRGITAPRVTADLEELGDFSHEHEPSFAGAFSDAPPFADEVEPDSLGMPNGWDQDGALYGVEDSSRTRNLIIGVGLVALIAGGALWLNSGPTAEDSTAAGSEVAQVDHALLTGQVLGSLAAAQDSVNHADFASAQRAVASTYRWIEDADLAEDARVKRVALNAKIERLIELDTAFSSALNKGDCTRAGKIIKTMSAVEASVERVRAGALAECKASVKSPLPAKPAPAPAPPAEEPAAAPIQPAPAPQPPAPVEAAPKPPEVAPEEAPVATPPSPEPADSPDSPAPSSDAPGAEAPETPTSEASRLDEVMPELNKPDAATGEDEDEESPEEADPEEGFALPPKTID